MEKKSLKSYPLLVCFALFILIMFVADMIMSRREYSEMENRYLKQRPVFSVKSLIENEYTLKYEEYINDQFVGRDAWITLKSVSETALGKIENNGVAYGREGYQFEKAPSADEATLRNNMGYLLDFLEEYQGHVTVGIIPNSYQMLRDKIPVSFPGVDQEPYIREVYDAVKDKADHLELSAVMAEHAGEYIYYRTDHHWTTLGAFYAYEAYARSRGLEAASREDIAPYARNVENFLGTYYSKSKKFDTRSDIITWYDFPVGEVTIDGKTTVLNTKKEEIPVEGMYEASKWEERDKYAAFLYGNNGLTVIPSGCNLDRQEGRVSRVLLIKDSYGNSFAPFLTWSYDEVYAVDLRSLTEKMSELTSRVQFDDVLILYNYQSFESDRNIARLTY